MKKLVLSLAVLFAVGMSVASCDSKATQENTAAEEANTEEVCDEAKAEEANTEATEENTAATEENTATEEAPAADAAPAENAQ